MVRILAGAANKNEFIDNPYFNTAHYSIYRFMTPSQREQYQANLQKVNPMEYKKLVAQQKREELDIIGKKVREVEKKIKEYKWYEGKYMPFSKTARDIESLYKVRGGLIKQGEEIADYKGTPMSDALVSFSNGENHIKNLRYSIYSDEPVQEMEKDSGYSPEDPFKQALDTTVFPFSNINTGGNK
jgi:hypothetical protein